MATIEEMYAIVNQAIDYAFYQEKYTLRFLDYLNAEKFKKDDVKFFISSSLGVALQDQVDELDLYLLGGQESYFVREAYNWLGKPRARKIRDYLNGMMEDAKTYEQSKRRGRKPGSTNKKKPATANK